MEPADVPSMIDLRLTSTQTTRDLAWTILEASPDALMVVDADGHIVLLNEALELMFGYDRHELHEMPVEILVPLGQRAVHVAHRTRYQAAPVARGMQGDRLLRGRRKDATEFPVEVRLSPVPALGEGYSMATVRDITSGEAARAHDRLVKSIVDSIHDGVFIFSPDSLRFTYVNEGAMSQCGYSEAELLSMTPLHIKPEFTESRFRDLLEPLLAGRIDSVEFTTTHRRKDGRDLTVDIVLEYPDADDPGETRLLVAIVRDVTERERQQAFQMAISEVRARLLEANDLPTIVQDICRYAHDLVKADVTGILLPSDDGSQLELVAAEGSLSDERVGLTIPIEGTAAGEVYRTGVTLCTDDINSRLTLHPVLQPILAEIGPLVASSFADGVSGVLAVGRLAGRRPFDDDDMRTVDAFTREVAVAMHLARARANETRVSILEDRERIAADLHDLVIQRIFGAGMGLQAARAGITEPGTQTLIDDTIDELDRTIAEIRSTIFHLGQHGAADPVGAQIEQRAHQYADLLGFDPVVRLRGPVDDLPGVVLEQLLPSLNEILANVARHAEASRVDVEVAVTDHELTLTVADDGVGLTEAGVRGLGLDNLQARARRVAGSCAVTADPQGGTIVTWSAPIGS